MSANVLVPSPGNVLAALAKKSKNAAPHNRGDLDHVHIEPASNGVMVTTRYEPKNPKANYPEPDRAVFGDHASAMEHIGAILAPHFVSPLESKE